jgi:hypothetical protein
MLHPVKDTLVLAALLLAFATFLTTHLSIVVRMLWRVRPWHRGVLAMLLPPLVPFWAWRERWKRMVYLWFGALVVYGIARVRPAARPDARASLASWPW